MTDTSTNLLDLIYTSNLSIVTCSGTLSSFSHLDHYPVFLSLNVETPHSGHIRTTVWDYKKLNIELFIQTLTATDWDEILLDDVDTATERFTASISKAAKLAIPTRLILNKTLDKPWVNGDLKRQIRKRDYLDKQN